MAIFYTADLQFGHRGLVVRRYRRYRPWETVDEHDAPEATIALPLNGNADDGPL
ncbi:hypothetical protein Ga0074812_12975 [Parafrankia irregularis]|uniref:Uncharacterized protein n=1 Tax=Parafrankia irregularis TaxID=795642 RepID=A0A0S4QW67_9ACTN|nr:MULTISPECIES: hypothetical protein [Parafrankia]MBE3202473.1 hypothetical protein [Parafrankia sp. CH37]CUU59604.1 hypothetical protein Ga0074812_12975 [Parafrankia irregularis]